MPSRTCVRRQAAGIDVIDDGEMGKSSWITYLYERTSGIEPRMVATEGGRRLRRAATGSRSPSSTSSTTAA